MEVDDKTKNDIQQNINQEEAKKEQNTENNNNNKNNEDVEMNIEEEEKVNNLQKIFTKFLNEHTIYEAIPEDMKILVFNDELLIKDSIEAMIKEDIYCGLLYNSQQNKHSGVFTIRDVLGLLLVGYKKLVSFLNNNKNINSLDLLKNNLNTFFAQFDNIHNNNKNENENKENILKQSNENDMDIEEDINNNNEDIKNKNKENINDNDPKIYNDIIKDFHQFISLFDNITLQSFIELIYQDLLLMKLFSNIS